MSNQIPIEVYEEVYKMCQRNFLQHFYAGEEDLAFASWKRAKYALSMVEKYKAEQENE